MKKRANAITVIFILGFSLLILSSFGVDAAFVILSRYKLQKVTEFIALEYASTLNSNINNVNITPDSCKKINNNYTTMYNLEGSGLSAFKINEMRYMQNDTSSIVYVNATSKVMPAFLRFVGIVEVNVSANAYAISEKITPDTNPTFKVELSEPLSTSDEDCDFSADKFNCQNSKNFKVEFNNLNITAKNTSQGDFALNYLLSDGTHGGFFIFAGYRDENGNISYKDIADAGFIAAKTSGGTNTKISPISVNMSDTQQNCIDNQDVISFDLSESNTPRITDLIIYKAMGEPETPCKIENPDSAKDYINQSATVELTVLNNVKLTNAKKWKEFSTGEVELEGFCELE